MSDDTTTVSSETTTVTTNSEFTPTNSNSSHFKTESAIQSLSSIIPSLPPSLSVSANPALSLLHDSDVSSHISSLLRQPNSGSGDNNLCRWLYDTFQSSVPDLQLLVLRFLPTIAGLYLSRVTQRIPLAGFEAVLLALYAHETTSRAGQPITVNIPDISHPSLYHESKAPINNNATNLNLAVISPSLEPHGTVRSTKRARIVGVALELYYSKISQMPIGSKIDFCEFCRIWAGQDGKMYKEDEIGNEIETESELSQEPSPHGDDNENENDGIKEGRIPLPWELLQPILRIMGHCMIMGPSFKEKELIDAAGEACRSLYARSLHDINPKAILATRSLLRLSKMAKENDFDPTEIPQTNVISL
ncbi:Hyccin [Quillaja saponaria]|uniref:Hyccin n=1 Tax=Quillaja saponaria TaxID=32244 RepID=A0AAD7PMG6_QUISA|nr:Hyccin [Quillaja saponaria]